MTADAPLTTANLSLVDGRPVEVPGPLGLGYVRSGNRHAFTLDHGSHTTIPGCQGSGRHGYGQCLNAGRYLEHDIAIRANGAAQRDPRPGEPRFYWCGVHAPSQVGARRAARRAREDAANAQYEAARAAQRAEAEAASEWYAERLALESACAGARAVILDRAREDGLYPDLFAAVDRLSAALAAHVAAGRPGGGI